MQNFQDTFETRKRSFICAFSIWVIVDLRIHWYTVNSWKVSYKFARNALYFFSKNRKQKLNFQLVSGLTTKIISRFFICYGSTLYLKSMLNTIDF